MATELECPICDADIFLDGEEKLGDIIQCSYCKMSLKILAKKNKWTVTEDFDELG
jgi:DNA-directed RNA polymerase subunit RPC12/RpoP